MKRRATGIAKTAGSVAWLLLVVGLAAFFFGTLGPIRASVLVGVALIVLSLGAFAIEEFGPGGTTS